MGDFRKTWQTINELTSRKSEKRSVTSVNGVSITNPTALSNQFNNHFATISPKTCKQSLILQIVMAIRSAYLNGTDKRFQLLPISTNKVLSLYHSNHLNKSKAAGLDKISARLIRECTYFICIPTRDRQVKACFFSDYWKWAKFTPLLNELFFCKKKIPLSRRVGHVMDGWFSEWISGSERDACHTNQIRSTIKHQSNFLL